MHLFRPRTLLERKESMPHGFLYEKILGVLNWIAGDSTSLTTGGVPETFSFSYIVSPNRKTCGDFCNYKKDISEMSSIVGMRHYLEGANQSEIASQVITTRSRVDRASKYNTNYIPGMIFRECGPGYSIGVACQECGRLARRIADLEKGISNFTSVLPPKGPSFAEGTSKFALECPSEGAFKPGSVSPKGFGGYSVFRLGADESKVRIAKFNSSTYLVGSLPDSSAEDRFSGNSYVFTKLKRSGPNAYTMSSSDTCKLADLCHGNEPIKYEEVDASTIAGLELPDISTAHPTLGTH